MHDITDDHRAMTVDEALGLDLGEKRDGGPLGAVDRIREEARESIAMAHEETEENLATIQQLKEKNFCLARAAQVLEHVLETLGDEG